MSRITTVDAIGLAFGVFDQPWPASFFPQIVAVMRDSHRATAISLMCWSSWVAAIASAALYSWVHRGDAGLAIVGAFSSLCCLAVLTLAVCKRVSWLRRGSPGRLSA